MANICIQSFLEKNYTYKPPLTNGDWPDAYVLQPGHIVYLYFTQYISTDRHQYTGGLQIQNSSYRSTASGIDTNTGPLARGQ